jgi:hypothetical protein
MTKIRIRLSFILGMAEIFRSRSEFEPRAKVGAEVTVMVEFSGFACSCEQAKNRRKPGETRLSA